MQSPCPQHSRQAAFPGVPAVFESPADRAEFKPLHGHAGVELYRAHIVQWAFEPHTHDAFGVGAIERGVERFRYRGSDQIAPPQSLVLMNPDTLHTGRAETASGWAYRMAYIDEATVRRISGDLGWSFDHAVAHDPATAQRVSACLAALWGSSEALHTDGLLLQLLELLRPHARVTAAKDSAPPHFAAAWDLLQDDLTRTPSLEQLAAAVDLSPWHFQRTFKARHGATPHQALMALRLVRAKQLLARGEPPAAAAAAVGLADQAHLTRAFRRRYGVTPGRYRRQVGAA